MPSYNVKNISVNHPDFTTVIQEHFDILWQRSIRLNENNVGNQDRLKPLNTVVQQ